MDADDIRAALTLVSFIAFLGIVWWAYSARRKRRFDRDARSVIEDDDDPKPDDARGKRR
jgi:cytochrome c oxidase cbb3-type subunit 4